MPPLWRRWDRLLLAACVAVEDFDEQALVSLKLNNTVDVGVGWTFAVIIEGG